MATSTSARTWGRRPTGCGPSWTGRRIRGGDRRRTRTTVWWWAGRSARTLLQLAQDHDDQLRAGVGGESQDSAGREGQFDRGRGRRGEADGDEGGSGNRQ